MNELNDRQTQVVDSSGGYQLVIASAGSGKTKTLVHRVAALIQQGVSADNILLLTFTRKAADEMKDRVIKLIGDTGSQVVCGTFHSFALMVLRKYHDYVNVPRHFSILDAKDETNLIDIVANDAACGGISSRTVLEIFSFHINTGKSIKDICAERKIKKYSANAIHKLFPIFMEYKRANAMLDFDDMLYYLELMLRTTKVGTFLSRTFHYVLVDEFQDTNHIQSQIVKYLGQYHHNVMAVGDEAQSIYKFRGADFENIMKFPKEFPSCQVIKLEQNYRSTEPILDLANAVSESFLHKFEKSMFTVKPGGKKPIYYRAASEEEQAQWVVSKIKERIRSGVKPHECAVLYRANSSAIAIESQLKAAGVPCVKAGDRSLFDKAHIRDLLAYLKVCHYRTDTVAWTRVLHMHPGIGPATVTKLIHEIVDNKRYIGALKDYKGTKNENVLKSLFMAIKEIRSQKGPTEALRLAFTYYNQFFRKLGNTEIRKQDVDILINLSRAYKSCRSMLTDIMLDPKAEREFNGVVLSTVHSAKGLEWDSVWVINVTEDKFPNKFLCKTDDELEEERRLFYVAITRAKKNLAIVAPMQSDEIEQYLRFGYVEHSHESPFMTENPRIDDCVKTVYSSDLATQSRSKLARQLYAEYE